MTLAKETDNQAPFSRDIPGEEPARAPGGSEWVIGNLRWVP